MNYAFFIGDGVMELFYPFHFQALTLSMLFHMISPWTNVKTTCFLCSSFFFFLPSISLLSLKGKPKLGKTHCLRNALGVPLTNWLQTVRTPSECRKRPFIGALKNQDSAGNRWISEKQNSSNTKAEQQRIARALVLRP